MYGYSLFWIIAIFVSLGVWGFYIGWKYKTSKADARAVFDANLPHDKRLKALDFSKYERVYMRAFGPRPAIYAALSTLTALVTMPLCFVLSETIFNLLWNSGGQDEVMDYGLAPWLFFVTLIMIAIWISIGAIFVRLYYHNKPKSFDKELEKELQAQ